MGINVINLINYLRSEGLCDEDLLPIATKEDTPPPVDESTDEGETNY